MIDKVVLANIDRKKYEVLDTKGRKNIYALPKETHQLSNNTGIMAGFTYNGSVFYFDKAMFNVISRFSWHSNSKGYVYCSHGGKKISMHGLVLLGYKVFDKNFTYQKVVDHINRMPNHNYASNLRLITSKENAQNTSLASNNTSGCTGVVWNTDMAKWRSRCVCDGYNIEVGKYNEFTEAVLARSLAVMDLYNCRPAYTDKELQHVRMAMYKNSNLCPEKIELAFTALYYLVKQKDIRSAIAVLSYYDILIMPDTSNGFDFWKLKKGTLCKM